MIDAPRRPSVAVIAHALDRNGQGMERLHAEIVTRLSAQFSFTVFADHVDNETLEHCAFVKIPVVDRPIPLRFAQFYVRATHGLRKSQRRFDLVHSCGAITAGRVDVVTIHLLQAGVIEANGGLAPSGAPPLRRVNTGALKAMALMAERRLLTAPHPPVAAAVSVSSATEIARFYPSVEVVLTENAIEFTRFDATDDHARQRVRDEFTVSDATSVVLAVGGDWHLRGIPLVIDALATLDGDVELWICGRGDTDAMRARAATRGVTHKVRFLGVRDDLEAVYRAADVLVQASAYETFSLVLVEAARSMLPLVTTDVGVASELCGDGDGGVIVERSADGISAGLRTVIGDPARAHRCALVAKERTDRFSYDQLCASTTAMYESLLERRRR